MSHSELEAESHQAEVLVQENTTLKSQLEELHQRLAGKEEVDSATSTRQQLEQVKVLWYCQNLFDELVHNVYWETH